MKSRLICNIIPVLLVAGNVGAAEIYNQDGHKLDINGTVAGVHHFRNSGVDKDNSYARFGFLGETQINPLMTGYGQWQYQAQLGHAEKDSTQESFTRLGFVGIKFAEYGSFDYGRNFGVLYDVLALTDRQPELAGDAFSADNYLSQRGNNLATYRNKGLFGLVDGLDVAVQYQAENRAGETVSEGRSVQYANGNGYGMSIAYDFGFGISATGAFTSSNRTTAQKTLAYGHGGDKANAYAAALKYEAQRYYLAVMYSQSYNLLRFGEFKTTEQKNEQISGFANKASTLEVVAQYLFDVGLTPSLAYVQTQGHRIENYGRQDLRKFIDLGVTYNFNKNMSTFIDYKINLLEGNEFTEKAGIKQDNIVALGLQYQF
ncbi:porin [Acerihabitans sp. TG2]|uniref:porin n=1 Tax=Acerihabitans sp. TG2 TaxID=3096008 RepID=UPI002B2387A7|nr:porin [Acerihabitans sp. TG2]MEA9389187.1 porin [Acerihabitans sp. TG2]